MNYTKHAMEGKGKSQSYIPLPKSIYSNDGQNQSEIACQLLL